MSAPRLAVVVGSGSVKCAAAIGLWRVLRRERIDVDLLVGCSGGAIFAAALALGHDADTVEGMAARFFTREATGRRDRRALWRAALPRLFGFPERWGLRDDRPVLAALRGAFGDRTFADTTTRALFTATDFRNGEQVVLSEGALVDALRASIAIPFAFAPWPVGDRLLVDGFLSDPLPVGVAVREGAHVIVAMGFESPYQSRLSSASRYAFQVSSIMTNNLLRASFAFHGMAHHGEVIPIIPRFERRVGLFDTKMIPYVVEEGERAAEEQVPYLRRLLAAPG
ncbi:MAG: patatin-like phospholipase family protein [Gemmatirosa sp.]|nr:patatin-like phospholipase family protein [Gemmatirosa sp.]